MLLHSSGHLVDVLQHVQHEEFVVLVKSMTVVQVLWSSRRFVDILQHVLRGKCVTWVSGVQDKVQRERTTRHLPHGSHNSVQKLVLQSMGGRLLNPKESWMQVEVRTRGHPPMMMARDGAANRSGTLPSSSQRPNSE